MDYDAVDLKYPIDILQMIKINNYNNCKDIIMAANTAKSAKAVFKHFDITHLILKVASKFLASSLELKF